MSTLKDRENRKEKLKSLPFYLFFKRKVKTYQISNGWLSGIRWFSPSTSYLEGHKYKRFMDQKSILSF